MKEMAMYLVLRLDYENGLHLEYTFTEEAAARMAKEAIRVAVEGDGWASFQDQAGRQAEVKAKNLQCVQLIELPAEVQSTVEVGLLVEKIRTDLLPQAPAPQQFAHHPPRPIQPEAWPNDDPPYTDRPRKPQFAT